MYVVWEYAAFVAIATLLIAFVFGTIAVCILIDVGLRRLAETARSLSTNTLQHVYAKTLHQGAFYVVGVMVLSILLSVIFVQIALEETGGRVHASTTQRGAISALYQVSQKLNPAKFFLHPVSQGSPIQRDTAVEKRQQTVAR
jgi:hypothetical protein